MENALVLQAGGPTSVINASLAGVIATWQGTGGKLLGARLGLQGLVHRDWVDLTDLPEASLVRLQVQPAAALGSGRFNPNDGEFARALEHLRAQEIGHLFLIGGNGTMGAARRLAAAAPWLRVVGIPKTIDNDLSGTDVAPGYGSAARYLALAVRDAWLDLRAMSNFDDVTIVETMGRHSGWLAAATVLARHGMEDAPHLVLLPEAPVDEDAVLNQVSRIHARLGVCLVVAAEGACDTSGAYLAEKLGSGGSDARGQVVLSMAAGVAAYLGSRVQKDLGLRCRQVRPNPLQRTSSSVVSELDRELAWAAGASAVEAARRGQTGVMMGLRRRESGWTCEATALDQVVGIEHKVPSEMILRDRYDLTQDFYDYAAPLAGPLGDEPVLWV